MGCRCGGNHKCDDCLRHLHRGPDGDCVAEPEPLRGGLTITHSHAHRHTIAFDFTDAESYGLLNDPAPYIEHVHPHPAAHRHAHETGGLTGAEVILRGTDDRLHRPESSPGVRSGGSADVPAPREPRVASRERLPKGRVMDWDGSY